MNNLINALSESVLAKSFVSNKSSTLIELAEKYPYAAVFQLLNAKKMQQTKDVHFDAQFQKTLLHFNNPLLINHIINHVETEISAMEADDIEPQQETDSHSHENKQADLLSTSEGEMDTDIDQTEGEESLPPLPEFRIEAIDPHTAPLSFTPYHSIDYFAAQGIKLSEDQFNNDRIGNQLRNFTAWLKQMKRLPGSSIETNITLTEEKNIEQLAAQSIHGNNADTEAMADVWIKQGDTKKAIELYQKLSLQNPQKSAFFAAKIEFLKNRS